MLKLSALRNYWPLLVFGALVSVVLIFSRQLHYWLIAHPPHSWMPFVTAAQDFLTLTLSVIIEASPFLVLGVIIATLIRRFVSPRALLRRLPRHTLLRRLILSIIGMLLPVCECGNVPVARSLLRNGLSPADAVTFLLAAPILNPITIAATATAFAATPHMVWWRIGAALIIVQVVALVVSRLNQKTILQPDFIAHCQNREDASLNTLATFAHSELWQLFRMLVIGAMIAAATQVFIPRDILTTVGSDVILSVLAMITLGFVVSICSSVDAFFALAYVGSFAPGAILAFLVAGPMIDIKMIALLKSTFTARFVSIVTAITFGLTLLIGVGVNWHVG
ncbi:MAG: permease [Candidatus Saccharibacteria bacterium]|nr:permease [Candidatus Saccharibacteria bacterium]